MMPLVLGSGAAIGEIVFVGAFAVVALCIATVLVVAALRTRRAIEAGEAERLRWRSEFADLPDRMRRCRHTYTGARPADCTCENGFDCRCCEGADGHRAAEARRPAPAAAETTVPDGALPVPDDRRYHRGHTWVRPREDGTLEVGLAPLGERLLGDPDRIVLPPVGVRLASNGVAFRVRRGAATARVLAPVDGVVVETGGPGADFYLRLRPDEPSPDLSHLLTPAEARAWLRAETDRLQGLLAPTAGLGTTLADGGALVPDLPGALPTANWDAIWSEFFLEP